MTELDAAEQACADAYPNVVDCAAEVSQRRAEIQDPLRQRARTVANLTQLDIVRQECETAFVNCSNAASARQAEIEGLILNVTKATSLVLLDAAADACAAESHGAVDCAADVDARRLQITELHQRIRKVSSIPELDALEQECAETIPDNLTSLPQLTLSYSSWFVDCDTEVWQRRAEIEDPLRERVRAARNLTELLAANESCAEAFVDCQTAADAREAEIEGHLLPFARRRVYSTWILRRMRRWGTRTEWSIVLRT
jgi:hypothetical protein